MDVWIKLYKKFSTWQWYKKSEMVHLFIHLLLNANDKDKMWNGIEVKRGQVVTGRRELSRETGLSERTIRTCLDRLKSTHEVTLKTTHNFSILTICKFEDYQSKKNKNVPQNDHEKATTKEDIDIIPSVKPEGSSLHSRLKTAYVDWYLNLTGVDYYWQAKDGASLKKMITKLKNRALKKNMQGTDDDICRIFNGFLLYIGDTDDKSIKWIKETATMSILDSQFQVIIAQGHKSK